MTKHTPGQWYYDPEDRVVIREGDADIAHMDQSASEADARLITAAPALLKLCEEFVEEVSAKAYSPGCEHMGPLVIAGRKIIREIKGDPK